MKKTFNLRFKCHTYELISGEYIVTVEPDVALTTLVGSCVAVCLFDEENGVVGMNHFMLPDKSIRNRTVSVEDAKYGTAAMDMLIKDMINAGAKRQNLKAKVFGAGRVVDYFTTDISGTNAEFTKKYLSALKIPVIAEDLGGNTGRKLFFFSRSKEVYLKRIKDG